MTRDDHGDGTARAGGRSSNAEVVVNRTYNRIEVEAEALGDQTSDQTEIGHC